MLHRIFDNFAQIALRLTLVLALGIAGGAHRVLQPIDDPDLLAYVQMGGDLADICGDDRGYAPHVACDVCNLIVCFEQNGMVWDTAHQAYVVQDWDSLPDQEPFSRPRDRARAIRAPPSV
ncbi:hypothetical protein GCM10007939_05520 [Amylibacter marinus]|uniref:Uncharacterized protein n=1 Tax=Amylibacter marinus TaxID=1475483 RepID=A0ABQ5VSG0_9RHOB|nr:hypothetical protein [Amylibacter marinus]GLQ34269.1 hypothetical protein GCM10007939_05520 [Amylibacter marinus]